VPCLRKDSFGANIVSSKSCSSVEIHHIYTCSTVWKQQFWAIIQVNAVMSNGMRKEWNQHASTQESWRISSLACVRSGQIGDPQSTYHQSATVHTSGSRGLGKASGRRSSAESSTKMISIVKDSQFSSPNYSHGQSAERDPRPARNEDEWNKGRMVVKHPRKRTESWAVTEETHERRETVPIRHICNQIYVTPKPHTRRWQTSSIQEGEVRSRKRRNLRLGESSLDSRRSALKTREFDPLLSNTPLSIDGRCDPLCKFMHDPWPENRRYLAGKPPLTSQISHHLSRVRLLAVAISSPDVSKSE
jgi:hypothetical protein